MFIETISSLRKWMTEFDKRGQFPGVAWDWLTEIVTTCLELHIFPPLQQQHIPPTTSADDNTPSPLSLSSSGQSGNISSSSNNINITTDSKIPQWEEEEVLLFITKFHPFLSMQRVFLLCNQLQFEKCIQLMHKWEDVFEAEHERSQTEGNPDGVDLSISMSRPKSERNSKRPLWNSLDDMLSVTLSCLYSFLLLLFWILAAD